MRLRAVFICPSDLEYCDRSECAGGNCKRTGERALNPCHGCGSLVVIRGIGICVDCTSGEATGRKER
jgi:hypothetical protein